MSDYNKMINDLRKLVDKNTRDIEVINEILDVHVIPCDGFISFKLSIDKFYNEQETGLTTEDILDIQLFDENNNILTNETGVVFTYSYDYIKVILPEKHNIRKLGLKLKREETNIPDEFSLFGSNDGKSFYKLSMYSNVYELLKYNYFVCFDVPAYIMHDSIISTLTDEGNNINKYETLEEYENDTLRDTPSISYIEETNEIINDK